MGSPERELSVVTNDDANGAHALMFESGDGLSWTTGRPARSGRITGRPWRTSARGNRRSRTSRSRNVLRRLAAEGHENFTAIMMGASRELSVRIANMTNGRGRTIQILRTKPSFAHHWLAVHG
jgi:hypothetical protein